MDLLLLQKDLIVHALVLQGHRVQLRPLAALAVLQRLVLRDVLHERAFQLRGLQALRDLRQRPPDRVGGQVLQRVLQLYQSRNACTFVQHASDAAAEVALAQRPHHVLHLRLRPSHHLHHSTVAHALVQDLVDLLEVLEVLHLSPTLYAQRYLSRSSDWK